MMKGTNNSWAIRLLTAVPLVCLTLVLFVFAAVAAGLATIDPLEAAGLIQKEKGNPDFVILDIRTPREFQQGHIDGAVLLDYYDKAFVEGLKALDKNRIYLVYCRSGNRSGKALAVFEKLGFQRVYNMAYGINGWLRAGMPLGS